METIYETDFYEWTQQQAALLRQCEFNRLNLDFENIAEEIESMGRREKHSVQSYLSNVMMHLLKWKYQPNRQCKSWRLSIINGRSQIKECIDDSPSLMPQIEIFIAKKYAYARMVASEETSIAISVFPKECPFTVAQMLEDYWPD